MKRILGLVLAMMMVLSMSAAMAEEEIHMEIIEVAIEETRQRIGIRIKILVKEGVPSKSSPNRLNAPLERLPNSESCSGVKIFASVSCVIYWGNLWIISIS